MQPTGAQRLRALRRTDKCVVSNAQRLIYAPTHPRYSHILGLWDEAHFYNHPIGSLGTLSIVDEKGTALHFEMKDRDWQPDRLVRTFETSGTRTLIRETVEMLSNDTLRVSWSVHSAPIGSHAIIWTALGSGPYSGASSVQPIKGMAQKNGFQFEVESTFEVLDQPNLPLSIAWEMTSPVPDFVAICASQGRPPEPDFTVSPFYDSFDGSIKGSNAVESVLPNSLLYGGLQVTLINPVTDLVCEIVFSSPAIQPQIPCQVEFDWVSFFDRSPSFVSDDPWLNTYFDYRLFGLRMNAIPGGSKNIPYPAVCEGPGYFRAPITYSAQCHLLETRWLFSSALAQGSILNFMANQSADGNYIGYLGPLSLPGEFFYHANWGRILELDTVHEDPEFLRRAFESLAKYVAFFDATRDPENSGLYDILNHYETGQEYMHRYVAVEPSADTKHWGQVFRLKGVDVSVYMYQIKQALTEISRRNSWLESERNWANSAQKTGNAILRDMWDPEQEMFFDIDPLSWKRTNVKAAVCFYPYLTDLVDSSHLIGLKRLLRDPNEFNTPYPVPSSAVSDPFYNADGLWKGERKNCPWNGRVWPMTNSHVAELLAACARRFGDGELTQMTVDFISKYIRMMFFDGDPASPNSFEHYHPENGRPSVFRGVDDYQHSWILDLIIQTVCGVRPSNEGISVDPFPFDLTHFKLENLIVRGRTLSIERKNQEFLVAFEGGSSFSSIIGSPIFIPFTS